MIETKGTSNTERSASKKNRTSSDQHDNIREAPSVVIDKEEQMAKPTSLMVSILTSKEKIRDDEFTLQDVEFTTTSHSLTAITGPVGSGKSSLLSAIAGEGSCAAGTITWPPCSICGCRRLLVGRPSECRGRQSWPTNL